MAAETPTGSTEGRALSAALTAPSPFAGRAASLALHASDRHVDRWAPEHDAVRRSRSLGALTFVDRLLQPWMHASATPAAARPRMLGASAERAHAVSWVFPRPWYQDELDWMAAAREADYAPAAGRLTTRGTFAGPAVASMPAGGDARQAVVVVADQLHRRGPVPAASLEYVAPSLGLGSQAAPSSASGPVRALRAWSPQVSFAAAQAAEVMASTVAATEHAGLSAAQRSPLLEGLAYVTPEEIAAPEERRLAGRTAQTTDAPSQVQLARAVAQLAAAQAVSRVASPTAETSRAAAEITRAPEGSRIAPSSAPAEAAYRAEHERVVEAITRSPDGSRTAAPESTAAAPTAFATLVQTASSSPAASQAMRAVELFARAALTGAVAPASGPRVAMPAGLGGALVGFDAAETTRHAMVVEPQSIAPIPGAAPTIAPFRGFAPVWAATAAATPALNAVASERPAAMTHLAWADRWLARISGASPASLSALDVAAEHRAYAPRVLHAGAPEVVYVLPELTGPGIHTRPSSPARPAAAPALRALPPVPQTPPPGEALRIADDEAVPDDVFAAIARAARPGQKRAPDAPRGADAPRTPEIRAVAPPPVYIAKPTLADEIAHTAPAAPAAGLYAGLASSPMAPALAGILPMQTAPVFDPRALFAGGLLSAYVGGVMARGFSPVTQAIFAPGTIGAADPLAPFLGVAARAPGVEYVAPDAAASRDAGGEIAVAPSSPAQRMLSVRSPLLASAAGFAPFVAPTVDGEPSIDAPAPRRAAATMPSYESPLTQVDAAAWSPRPGMTAELAQGFAIDHERTAADLAFDFVAPEQVLAARVYGFGAVEAAQAARLAVAGRSGLSAMASALDLTFLRQLHVASESSVAAEAAGAQRAAMPRTSAAAAAAPAMTPITAWPVAPEAPAAATGTVFGVERRLPRGAFLWPAGVVAALDLRAELPEGASATNVAALELLAAGAVAHMGSKVAPPHALRDDDDAPVTARHAAIGGSRPMPEIPEMTLTAPSGADEPSTTEIADAVAVPAPQRARFEAIYQTLSRSAIGQSMSPSVRAARALAIAAAQDGASADGGSAHERARAAWSVMPAVYAGEGGRAPDGAELARAGSRTSSPELTLVSPSHGDDGGTDEMRPGLSRLAARAGEAIGSFVHPSGAEVNQVSSGAARVPSSSGTASADRGGGAADPFVHELIRTGRGFSRVGGGEAEIPSWFESAARKMLEQRGLGESLSVAELTLIASTPSRQVAASTRDAGGGPAPAMANAPPGQGGNEQGDQANIEKIAADVYAEILKLIDIARERGGDPWL